MKISEMERMKVLRGSLLHTRVKFLPHVPKYKISGIITLYDMLAEKDFGKICKAFLSCSRRDRAWEGSFVVSFSK